MMTRVNNRAKGSNAGHSRSLSACEFPGYDHDFKVQRECELLTMMTRRMLLAAPLVGAAVARAAEDYFPKPDTEGGWRTLNGAAAVRKTAHIDVKRLDQAFEYASRSSQHGGLLVARHGWLVYEKYYGRGNREANPACASVGKAYTSVACGIMLQQKRDSIPEGLETKVFNEKYLPEALPLDDPIKADIKLGHLLSMSAGLHGDGGNPGFVNGEPSVKLAATASTRQISGSGHGSASNSALVQAWRRLLLRIELSPYRLHRAPPPAGMEMQDYIDQRVAKPLGWGQWAWARRRGETVLPHAPGGGDIALRSTDHLRFACMLLKGGRWGSQQIVPAEYAAKLGHPSPYNRHSPFGFMFEVNAGGHVAGAPRDAYFKSGGGGYGICVVPSLDLVIYKMAGDDAQYNPERTGLPQNYAYDGSRDKWKPPARSQFSDGPIGTDDGVRRTLEMVVAAVTD